MPADGEITLRSLFREHNRFSMPQGALNYFFKEKGDVYGVSLANATVVSGGMAFARFMYFGRFSTMLHPSVPILFVMTACVSEAMILSKKKEEIKEKNKIPVEERKDYIKLTRRVPMAPEDMKNMPLSPGNLDQYGIGEKSTDKKECDCDEDSF